MKVALLTSGQPRFTQCFTKLQSQLLGFETADIYMCLWASDWAHDNQTARLKIQKILQPRYKLASVEIVKEPWFDIPNPTLYHPPPAVDNVRWNFHRRRAMWDGLYRVFQMLTDDYDLYVRFRLDGYVSEDIDLAQVDLTNDLIFPSWPRHGIEHYKLNDQFVLGTYKGIKLYCELGTCFVDYMCKADPNWEKHSHGTWASEHILGTYLYENGQPLVLGNFKSHLAGAMGSEIQGRSKYTDKHFHLPFLQDPTE